MARKAKLPRTTNAQKPQESQPTQGRKPRRTLPEDWPEDAPTHKACPDCYAEGRDPYVLPVATHFYIKKVTNSRYRGGYRLGAYCIEHEQKRAVKRLVAQQQAWREEEKRTGVAPPGLVRLRENKRRQQTPLTEAQKEARRKTRKAYEATHREELKRLWADWIAKPENAEARKRYQADWYQRVGKRRMEERRKGLSTMGNGLRKRRAQRAAEQAPPEPAGPEGGTA
ncbi:MAG: hypothetical protein HGA45_42125 [Chloroflexales bacterium]|nr:hypothetical protein [Chloroflexales bacterium]